VRTTQAFDADATTPRAARRFTASALTEAGVRNHDVIHRALLAVSELVTNAVKHAATPLDLEIAIGAVIRIAVRDGSPLAPQRRQDASAIGGRGLVLVEAVSLRWGAAPDGDGKWVWCELALGGDAVRS
jgi:anti-sigma regulatory factor (Ser/Thr protein kinase)